MQPGFSITALVLTSEPEEEKQEARGVSHGSGWNDTCEHSGTALITRTLQSSKWSVSVLSSVVPTSHTGKVGSSATLASFLLPQFISSSLHLLTSRREDWRQSRTLLSKPERFPSSGLCRICVSFAEITGRFISSGICFP